MVEAGAHQLPESTMLEALRMAHNEIRKLVEFPARLARCDRQADHELPIAEGVPGRHRRGARARRLADHRRCAQRRQGVARGAARSLQQETVARPRGAFSGCEVRHHQGLRVRGEEGRPVRDPRRGHPPGRAPDRRDPANLGRGWRPATHAWFRALHPGPDAGAVDSHHRFWSGSAENRRARPGELQALLSSLQLPAVLGRGGAAVALTWPPRDRPRRARRACGCTT